MTEDILNFPDKEWRLRRHRLFTRTRLSLLVVAILLCLANVLFIFISIPVSTPILSPPAFAGWSAPFVLSGMVVLVTPAVAFLIGSLLALIPIKIYSYYQRTSIAVFGLCIILEGFGLYSFIVDFRATH